MKRLIFILIPALFVVFFSCSKETSFELGINTPASGTLKDSLGDCTPKIINGTYTEGTALTNTNTVVLTVNVTVPGTYKIATDTVNGFSFIDSGFFSQAGTYLVTLSGSGTPILPITTDFTVTFGTSFCDFSVTVAPGTPSGNPNAADTAWMFDEGTRHYHGHADSAVVRTSAGIVYLKIYGKPATNDTTVYIQLQQTTPTPTGSYSTTSGMAVFEFKSGAGATIYDSRQGDGSNLTFTVTNYNTTTKVLNATFTGTAKDGATGTKTISGGKLKVQVQ
jgi:hypothetical protein